MPTAVYATRFAPTLSAASAYEPNPTTSFPREMRGRLLRVRRLLNNTNLLKLPLDYNEAEDGVHTVVGITRYGEPYLLRRLLYSGKVEQQGDLEMVSVGQGLGQVEVGIFSGDRDFVDGVRTRMESNLPPWILVDKTRRLQVWGMEDVYAIILRRRSLFR